jgi:hypothetical protein
MLTVEDTAGRFVSQREEFLAKPGSNRVEITLQPHCGLDLSLLDGEIRIPWDESQYSVQVIALNTGERIRATPPYLSLPGPGLYEVRFGAFPGYRRVTPERVWVRGGESAELEVRLARRY